MITGGELMKPAQILFFFIGLRASYLSKNQKRNMICVCIQNYVVCLPKKQLESINTWQFKANRIVILCYSNLVMYFSSINSSAKNNEHVLTICNRRKEKVWFWAMN